MADILSASMLTALLASFIACALLILTQRWHGTLSLDHDLSGAQKIHHNPVPRIGGVGVMLALVAGVSVGWVQGGPAWSIALKLLACGAPVFAAGLIEDLTKRVTVRVRLLASFASAALAVWFVDTSLLRLDTPLLDELMAWAPIALLFTCFAVAGMTNAVNIIDGLNGLAAGCVALMLAGLSLMAWQVGDLLVIRLSLLGVAALLGFLVLNFPFGRIFLGDGGAYLAGFWLAECGLLLLKRNPSVSTWAVLLCCLYPVWETVFSMYRRHFHRRVSSSHPDMIHMHHLVFKRVRSSRSSIWAQHGVASALIWLASAACPLVAALAYNQTAILATACVGFVLVYNTVYRHIRTGQSAPADLPDDVVAQAEHS